MKKLIFSSFLFLAVASQAATYKLDPAHTIVGFSVKHLVITKVKGRFNHFEGSFAYDDKKSEVSKVDVKIDAASVDTNNAKRDEHLRSPDFFDVKKYPEIHFKSLKPVVLKGDHAQISGELTMRGVTKPVTLDLTYGGAVTDPAGNEKIGFNLSGRINRKEWGLNWNKTLDKGGVAVSEEVLIDVDGEAQKQK